MRVWDLITGQCLTILEDHTDTVWGVAVTANGQRVVSGHKEGRYGYGTWRQVGASPPSKTILTPCMAWQ